MRRRSPIRLLLCGAALALAGGPPASAAGPTLPVLLVHRFALANGLEVLLEPRPGAPIVDVHVVYHVGSKDDPPGKNGLSHMLEHLSFKGSRGVRPDAHARMIDALGGRTDASTTEDVTAYTDVVPRAQLGFVLALEADRMRNLLLRDAAVATEREVIKNEVRWRFEDNPTARALLLLREAAYHEHPYGRTLLGHKRELDALTRDDCQRFYDRYYRPNNATLVVVGDLDETAARKQIEAAFGAMARGPAILRAYAAEPPQTQPVEKRIRLGQAPIVVLGYRGPAASSADLAPLELLLRILTEGDGARLRQRLERRERVAVGLGGFLPASEHPALFALLAVHRPEVPPSRVRDLLLEEVEQVRLHGVLARELEQARHALLYERLRKLETDSGRAGELALAHLVRGGWEQLGKEIDAIDKVDARAVQRAAETYLAPENVTIVIVGAGARGAGGP